MPFDQTLPADHSPIVAAELRNQLNALNDAVSAQPGFADIDGAILAGAAGNCNSVPPPVLPVSDPPTQAEVQAIVQFINDMYVPLTRT